MAQQAAPSASTLRMLMTNSASQRPRPVHAHRLVDGVAAQDALAALFDGVGEETLSSRLRSTDRTPAD